MKRRNLFFTVMMMSVFTLLGCGKAQTTNSNDVIMPNALALTDTAGDEMPDGTYHISFDGSKDVKDENGDYLLTANFYEYDRYAIDLIEGLKGGETIQYKGEQVKIDSVDPCTDESGNIVGIDLNGGLENGGIYLLNDKDEGCYRGCLFDDSYDLYSIGTGTIKISKDVAFSDYTGLEGPDAALPDSEIKHYDDLLPALQDKQFGGTNTYMTIRGNEVIQINVIWIP